MTLGRRRGLLLLGGVGALLLLPVVLLATSGGGSQGSATGPAPTPGGFERLFPDLVGGGDSGLLSGVAVVPQPVVGPATISFTARENAGVLVEIRAERESGRLVRRLAGIGARAGAPVRVGWDGRDDRGRRLPEGTYAAVLRARADAGGEEATAVVRFLVPPP